MKIGVNCGHTVSGQPGCGAVGFIDESAETRNVGRELINLLRRDGHTVFDCTNDYASSTAENLAAIVSMANAQPLDLFISIHFNSGGGFGTEVYTYGGKTFDEADRVCRNISALGFKNRGVKDGSNLYVIRKTAAKAMLIEICFVDTDDAQKYVGIGRAAFAEAISSAVSGTVKSVGTVKEYDKTNDIVWELKHRGIITDEDLWLQYCASDSNVYWFCRKLCQYVRTKRSPETANEEYKDIHNIVWDLNFRGILSDTALWEDFMARDKNVYYLLQKGLHYCRTH